MIWDGVGQATVDLLRAVGVMIAPGWHAVTHVTVTRVANSPAHQAPLGFGRLNAYVCGDMHGGDGRGCGLYFCYDHLWMVGPQLCERCIDLDGDGELVNEAFDPKPDHPEWIAWKLTDESWAQWRAENPEAVAAMRAPCHPAESVGGTPKTATE